MKCVKDKDGVCTLTDEKCEPDDCDKCSFYHPSEEDLIEQLNESLNVIKDLKSEIDGLNSVVLEHRAKNKMLSDKVLKYEFKAKLFDALVKGID